MSVTYYPVDRRRWPAEDDAEYFPVTDVKDLPMPL